MTRNAISLTRKCVSLSTSAIASSPCKPCVRVGGRYHCVVTVGWTGKYTITSSVARHTNTYRWPLLTTTITSGVPPEQGEEVEIVNLYQTLPAALISVNIDK